MITVGGIVIESVKKLKKTWKKDGHQYTSPDGKIIISIYGDVTIGNHSSIGSNSSIGDGSSIGSNSSIGYGSSIGNNCSIRNRSSIGSGSSIGDGSSIGNRSSIGDNSSIGNRSSIGDHSSIGNRSSIGNHSSIGDISSIGNDYELPVPPLWFSGPQYPIGYHSPGMIASGCIIKPVSWWLENIRRCAEEYHYSPEEIDEYEWRVKVLVDWMKRHELYKAKKEE